MTYTGDNFNNDVYSYTVLENTLTDGYYEYTAYALYGLNTTKVWVSDTEANGRLLVSTSFSEFRINQLIPGLITLALILPVLSRKKKL